MLIYFLLIVFFYLVNKRKEEKRLIRIFLVKEKNMVMQLKEYLKCIAD